MSSRKSITRTTNSSTAAFVLASAAEKVREMQAKKAAEKLAVAAVTSQPPSSSKQQRRRSSASSLAKAAAEAAERAAAELEMKEAERQAEENERLEMEERMEADAKRKRAESNFLGSSQGPRGRRGSSVSVGGGIGKASTIETSAASLQPSKRAPVTRTPPPPVQPIARPQPVNAFANVQNAAAINASKALAAIERAKQTKSAAAAESAAAFTMAANMSPSRAPTRTSLPVNVIEQETIVYEDSGLTMTQRKRRASKAAYVQEDQAPTPPNNASAEQGVPQMPTPREVLRHLFDPPAASGGWASQSSTLIGSLVGRGQQAALQFLSSSNLPSTGTVTAISSSSSQAQAQVSQSPGILDLSHLGVVAPNQMPRTASPSSQKAAAAQRPPFEANPTSGSRRNSTIISSSNATETLVAQTSSGLRQRFGGAPPPSTDASASSFLFSPTTEKITRVQLANIEHRKGVKTYYMWISALLALIILFYSITYYLLPLYSRHERFEAIKSHLRQRYGAAECASPFGSSPDVFADKAKVSYSDIHTSFCGGNASAFDSPCERAVNDVFSSSLLFVVEPVVDTLSGGVVSKQDKTIPRKLESLTVRAREGSWTLDCRLRMIWGWLCSQISHHRQGLVVLVILLVLASFGYRYFLTHANERLQKEKTKELIERLAKFISDVAEEKPYVPISAGTNLMEYCLRHFIEEENHVEARKVYADALRLAPLLQNVEVKGSGEGATIKFPRM